jgi:hypothetical protein
MDYEVMNVHEDGPLLRITGQLGDDPCWAVVAVIQHRPGPLQLIGLSVGRLEDEGALTNEVLRAVPLTEIMAAASRHFAMPLAEASGTATPTSIEVTVAVPAPGHRDGEYAQWASRYMRHVDAGSRRPVADLAAEYGMKPSAARDLIHTCREKGMLPKSRPGLKGGPLTEKARSLLGQTVPARPDEAR